MGNAVGFKEGYWAGPAHFSSGSLMFLISQCPVSDFRIPLYGSGAETHDWTWAAIKSVEVLRAGSTDGHSARMELLPPLWSRGVAQSQLGFRYS